MGKFDRRASEKMRRRKAQAKKKDRLKRRATEKAKARGVKKPTKKKA